MPRRHEYAVQVSWIGAAEGPTSSYAGYSREYRIDIPGKPALRGSADPTFRGDPALHNPEEMLVAALSACHMLSYLALCARARISVVAYDDRASGSMTTAGGGGRFTEVVLRPRVVLEPGSDLAKARALHEEAHAVCFIANSVNFPVRHEAEVTGAESAAPAASERAKTG